MKVFIKHSWVVFFTIACSSNFQKETAKEIHRIYSYNDITNESYGTLHLYDDFTFLLLVNTRAGRYELSGSNTVDLESLSLYVAEVKLNEFPQKNSPFVLTAPFEGDNLVIYYPYQTSRGYLYYRDNE